MAKLSYVRRRLSERLELPEDALGSTYRLQVIGDCAILCGCRKLLKYKSEEISALTKEAVITFFGEHLKCVYFFEGTIEVRGEIEGIGILKK